MGGTVGFVILEENKNAYSTVAWTGVDAHLFFSLAFVQGNMKKAISDVKRKANKYFLENIDESSGVAPHGYGLVVVDIKRQQIHTMQNYNFPFRTEFGILHQGLIRGHDLPFMELLKNDGFYVVDDSTHKTYSIKDFFGTLDEREIIAGLRSHDMHGNYKEERFPGGAIANYGMWDCVYVKPKGLDFEMIRYEKNPQGLCTMVQNLKSIGVKFSEKEKDAWRDFMEKSMENTHEISETLERIFIYEKKLKLKY